MIGKHLSDISDKGVRLRCSDHYSVERDGAILVGILLGKYPLNWY